MVLAFALSYIRNVMKKSQKKLYGFVISGKFYGYKYPLCQKHVKKMSIWPYLRYFTGAQAN